ncbi:MAG: hypothetical protein IIA00_07755 [Proteobacteria bacterium]|nr:hypothetical protein [Pseudomonadota bacterium]
MNARRTELLLMGALGLMGVALLFHIHHYNFLSDDAYINFRYMRNLARGDGLVYNVGERVEGYVDFLWILLCGGLMKLGIAPETSSRVITVACSLGVLVLTYLLGRRLSDGRGVVLLLAPAFLVANRTFAAWGTSGLEATTSWPCLRKYSRNAVRMSFAVCMSQVPDGERRGHAPRAPLRSRKGAKR